MIKPRIEIDKYAIRFICEQGQNNLFWQELFSPKPTRNFQNELMGSIRTLYEECIRQDIMPDMGEEEGEP